MIQTKTVKVALGFIRIKNKQAGFEVPHSKSKFQSGVYSTRTSLVRWSLNLRLSLVLRFGFSFTFTFTCKAPQKKNI